MDLVAGVRKEGSRGGRGDFKWSDVKDSSHRENYLGHSVMAPVGRWQQGKDLLWYSRGDEDPDEKARKEREERQQVKDAEEEAMAHALGLPPPQKSAAAMNANLTPLGDKGAQDTTAGEDRLGERDGGGDVIVLGPLEEIGTQTEPEIKIGIGVENAAITGIETATIAITEATETTATGLDRDRDRGTEVIIDGDRVHVQGIKEGSGGEARPDYQRRYPNDNDSIFLLNMHR